MLGINRKHHQSSISKKQWQLEEEEYEKEQQKLLKEAQKDDNNKVADNFENVDIPHLEEEEENQQSFYYLLLINQFKFFYLQNQKKTSLLKIQKCQKNLTGLKAFSQIFLLILTSRMSESDVEHLKNCTDSEEKEEIDEEVEQLLKDHAEKERRIRERKLNIPQHDEAQKIQVQQISSDDRDQRTIFIYNLPFDMANKEIEAYFQKFGKIIVCEVPKNEGSLVNKGRAFIEYSTVQEAQHALVAQNQQLRGRYIKINQGLTNVVSSLASSTNKLQQFKLEKEKGAKHRSHRHKSKSSSSSSEGKAQKQKKQKKKKHRHIASRSRSKSASSNSDKSRDKKLKHKQKKHKIRH